jgi:1-acyl-sn-glycerol-3-phosphate acyltransferase
MNVNKQISPSYQNFPFEEGKGPKTLNELLQFRGNFNANDKVITYLSDGRNNEKILTFGELLHSSKKIKKILQTSGLIAGDRVLLILPTSLHFIEWFFGIQAAGMVPVPVYPPVHLNRLEYYLRTLTGIIDKSQCRGAIIDDQLIPLIQSRLHQCGTDLVFFSVQDTTTVTEESPLFHQVDSSPAFLQFTSGTTSDPRGVLVQQKQLFVQLASFCETNGFAPGKTVVSWLPLYHDLGLIGGVLSSIYARFHLVLLSPLHFLREPITWFRAITNYKATHTCAPNFAYGLSVRKCPFALLEKEKIDLSSLERVGVGGEPVMMKTMEEFSSHFSSFGLFPHVIGPGYGLAENVLGVTGHRPGQAMKSVTISKKGMQLGVVQESLDYGDRFTMPSNGQANPNVLIRIVDDQRNTLEERKIGNIWVSGASVAAGYFNDREATKKAFLKIDNTRWLVTGDVGFLDQGELYICGRTKDLLIVHGKNYIPHDIEQIVGTVPGVRKGNLVAFAVNTRDSEKAVVIAELYKTYHGDTKAIIQQIKNELHSALGLVVEVIIVPKDTIPKTSSGKLQRSMIKKAYQDGTLSELMPPNRFLMALEVVKIKVGQLKQRMLSKIKFSSPKESSQVGTYDQSLDPKFQALIQQIKPEFDLEIDAQVKLDSLGFDSLERMELWMMVENLYRCKIPEEYYTSNLSLGKIHHIAKKYSIENQTAPLQEISRESLALKKLVDVENLEIPHIKEATKFAPRVFSIFYNLSKFFWNLQVKGTEKLPKEGGYILAGNHQTFLDGCWVRNALPENHQELLLAISQEVLQKSRIMRFFLLLMATVPVNPNGNFIRALQIGVSMLQKKRILLIFPEGTRTYNGRMGVFRQGVGLISLASGCPIVPFKIQGGFEVYSRHKMVPRLFSLTRKPVVRELKVTFGDPIVPPERDLTQSDRQLMQLVGRLREAIEEL